MCLQVPLRVQKVEDKKVIIEDGRQLIKEAGLDIMPGSFVIAYGNIVVSVLTAKEGEKLCDILGRGISGSGDE